MSMTMCIYWLNAHPEWHVRASEQLERRVEPDN